MEIINSGIETNADSGYLKIEKYDPESTLKMAEHYKEILRHLGEDPGREGLVNTPLRVAKALQYLTHGYDLNPMDIVLNAKFKEEYRQMVIVKDIEIYSL